MGKKLCAELTEYNLRRVGEVARVPIAHLVMVFGRVGAVLSQKARGIDPAPVYPPPAKPRLVEKESLSSDSNDFPFLLAVVRRLVERAGRRLRVEGQVAGKLSLRVRYADYRETRGTVLLPAETDQDSVVFESARGLFGKLLDRRVRVRCLELGVENLTSSSTQLPLFPAEAPSKTRRLGRALDRIRGRYGENAVVRSGSWSLI